LFKHFQEQAGAGNTPPRGSRLLGCRFLPSEEREERHGSTPWLEETKTRKSYATNKASSGKLWVAGHSRDVAEVLRQRQADRRLEEAAGLWVDDHLAVGGKKRRDLFLSAQGDLNHSRVGDKGLETVRVFRPAGVLSKGQIVAVERGAVGQVPRAQERRRNR